MERGIKFGSGCYGLSDEISDDDFCSGVTLRSLLGSPMNLSATSLTPLPATLGHSFAPISLDPSSAAVFDFIGNMSAQLSDFNSKVSDEPSSSSIFSRMPDLCSLEPPFSKRGRFDSSGTLESVVQPSVRLPLSVNNFLQLNSPASSAEAMKPQSQSLQARKRRQRISERLRVLGKLMPWNKKMDMSTLLQEASKYITFLQAQILVLQSMPIETSFFVDPPSIYYDARSGLFRRPFGMLGKLSRQQLLQILVDSPEAQSILFAYGWCVVSAEQLLLTNYN